MTPDQSMPPLIDHARLEWRDGQPVSSEFGDVYFSRENGLEETRYVFLHNNRLNERFSALASRASFVIAETGFGTGLNFLAAWQAFEQYAPEDSQLHFVSVEKFPLTTDDLDRALALWPSLTAQARELIEAYPALVAGCHRLILGNGRVRLTLYFGDVLEAMDELEFQADAWFLDGFAPACNPELWEQQVIEQVRGHSRPGATLATFTAVGRIRRALAATGFEVERVPGFGPKRDMIRGQLPASAAEPAVEPGTILVVGAGIAGATLARNLAERGCQVMVADRGDEPAVGASGNPQGALYGKLAVDYNDQSRLTLMSLLFAQRFYPAKTADTWHPTGLLMMCTGEHEYQRQRKFLARNRYPESVLRPVSAEEARKLTGVPCPDGGLWFPGSGWLEPATTCARLLDHPNIETVFGFEASRLLPCNNRWCLSGNGHQDLVADSVVLAAGHLTRKLMPVLGNFRMKAIRGQITELPRSALGYSPVAVITGNRYLNPPAGDTLVTGATFDLHDCDPQVRQSSHTENLEGLAQMLPGVTSNATAVSGRTSFRCTTHDYQPIVGPLVNGDRQTLENAWLLTGLGSKGLMWAPLMAEYLADCLTGQPRALPRSLAGRVAPARCLAEMPIRSQSA